MSLNNSITQITAPRRLSLLLPGGTTHGTAFTLIPAATFWAPTTAYALDERVVANGAVYRCITAGTSSGAGSGPSGSGLINADGTAVWMYEGTGWGWKIKGLVCTSSDNTNSMILGLQTLYNGIVVPMWNVQMLQAQAPPQGLVSSTSMMQGANVPSLPRDSTGTTYFYLDIFDALQVVSTNGVSPGSGISGSVTGIAEAW